jgi:HEAT repeat protein
MLVESLQCGRVRSDDARSSALAADLASTADMGENEPGVDPGGSILGAVDDAFEPRPTGYRTPKQKTPPLFGPSPAERLDRLTQLIGRGIVPGEAEAVARLLTSDPDPAVRWLAASGLAAGGHHLPLSLLATALADPYDRVRREVVALIPPGGREVLRLVLPLATDRTWPMTQLAVLQALPAMLRELQPLDPEVGSLLAAVASLDPPPLLGERAGLAAVVQAIGPDVLIRWLAARDIRRLGAARLLSLTGQPSAERALAGLRDDPSEEIRYLARSAAAALHARGETATETRARWAHSEPHVAAEHDTPPGVEAAPDEPALIASLARALADPGQPVRAQARAALDRVRREVLTDWAVRALERGSGEAAELAARVAGNQGLETTAFGLLHRAAGIQAEARGPYLDALEALALDPAELARLVAEVEPVHRQAAVRLAWQVGGQAVLPHLSSLLEDSAGPVRMAVIEVLAESGDPAGMAVARERLAADSSAAVRATAIHALARSEPSTRREALARALADPDPDVRATAVEALPDGIDGMVDLLGRAFGDEDERVWRASLSHLAALPPRDLPVVWRALRQAAPAKREELVRALEAVDPDRLMELATSNARAPSQDDRALAVELAARDGSVEASGLVVSALEDPDPGVRRTAAAAMATLRAPAAVPALSRSLADPQAEVRIEAIRALGLIDDDTVPDVLIRALKDPEVRVREMAADALSRWHSPAVARRLAAALASPDLRRSAGEVLERMGAMAIQALADVTTGTDPEASAAAGILLDGIAGPDPFIHELSSIEPDQRLRAVQVLAALAGPSASEALVSALSDPDVRVRSRAASALGTLGYLPALKQLRRMFLTDPVAEAAGSAEAALRRLGAVPDEDEKPAQAPSTGEDGAGAPND